MSVETYLVSVLPIEMSVNQPCVNILPCMYMISGICNISGFTSPLNGSECTFPCICIAGNTSGFCPKPVTWGTSIVETTIRCRRTAKYTFYGQLSGSVKLRLRDQSMTELASQGRVMVMFVSREKESRGQHMSCKSSSKTWKFKLLNLDMFSRVNVWLF